MSHAERLPLDPPGPLRPQSVGRGGLSERTRELLMPRPDRHDPATDYWIRVGRTAMACDFATTPGSQDAAGMLAALAAFDDVERIEDELSVCRGHGL